MAAAEASGDAGSWWLCQGLVSRVVSLPAPSRGGRDGRAEVWEAFPGRVGVLGLEADGVGVLEFGVLEAGGRCSEHLSSG